MKNRFRILIVVFLIVFNISFLLPSKKAEAVIPLAVPLAYSLGTFLLTSAGYYLTQSGALDPVLDKVVNTLVDAGEGAVRMYDNGKAWISKQVLNEVVDYINTTYSTPYVDNVPIPNSSYIPATNTIVNNTHDSSNTFTYKAGDVISFPGKTIRNLVLIWGNGLVNEQMQVNFSGTNYILKDQILDRIEFYDTQYGLTMRVVKTVDGHVRTSSGIDVKYINPKEILYDLGESVCAPGWVDSQPVGNVDVTFPNTSSIPNTSTDAGIVIQPKTQEWVPSTVYNPSDVNVGTGEVAEDGTLTDTIPNTGEGEIPNTGFWTSLWNWLQKIIDAILSIPGLIVTGIGNLLSALWEFLQSIVDGIGSIIASLTDSVLSIDVEAIQEGIMEPFKLPRFQQTWNVIQNFDTSSVEPPKLNINLGQLFSAGTSRFTSQNPFSNSETTFIDFSLLNQYSFGGMPLIAYFRFLTGVGFIWTTFNYCWRKLTPDTVI
ncbi:hypothetical protein [Clostridium intestinale]|uniref:Uncharacterized protein n=1 Tax=Clostridium intestinale URNW TaxID=1294142 RepID=U2NGI5_9CLOT|nr:hypothetical protein [Clostridium intestinale]ERK28218.1 hypothetical protein CINTURNW_4627 [Clostridium intestinale URNW]